MPLNKIRDFIRKKRRNNFLLRPDALERSVSKLDLSLVKIPHANSP